MNTYNITFEREYFNELSRFELSEFNDLISDEEHIYNGINSRQSETHYHHFLVNLHNIFFNYLNEFYTTNLTSKEDREYCILILNSIQDRITAIKSNIDLQIQKHSFEDNIFAYNRDISRHSKEDLIKHKMINTLKMLKFFNAMAKTQIFFLSTSSQLIEKKIADLTNPNPLHRNREKNSDSNIISNPNEVKLNSLSEYGDVLTLKDIAKIFNCTYRNVQDWQAKGIIQRCNHQPAHPRFNKIDILRILNKET